MTFRDVSLPDGFNYSSLFGSGFMTVVQQTASGHEHRIARQAQGRHKYRLQKILQDNDEIAALKAFVLRMRGALDSFRLKDVSDFTTATDGQSATASTDATLGTGDGSETRFQLIKQYSKGDPGQYDRTIELPVAGTTNIEVDGVAQTEGGGNDYTVTNPGGIITFNSPPAGSLIVKGGCEFDVPVRFEKTIDEWATISADASNVWSLSALDCIEVLNEVEYPERHDPGGAVTHGTATVPIEIDTTLSMAEARLHVFHPSTLVNAYLPGPSLLFPGSDDVMTIAVETGAIGTVQLRDDAGNTVGSALSAGDVKVLAALVTGGTINWFLR